MNIEVKIDDIIVTDYGIGQIAIKRVSQVVKHKRNVKKDYEHDKKYPYALARAAVYIIGQAADRDFGWSDKYLDKVDNYSYKRKLAIAGALLAAELDLEEYKEGLQE